MMGPRGLNGNKGDFGPPGPRGMPGPKGEPGETISAPEVLLSPSTQTITENSPATLFCTSSGNPRPAFTWTFGEKIVLKGSR